MKSKLKEKLNIKKLLLIMRKNYLIDLKKLK